MEQERQDPETTPALNDDKMSKAEALQRFEKLNDSVQQIMRLLQANKSTEQLQQSCPESKDKMAKETEGTSEVHPATAPSFLKVNESAASSSSVQAAQGFAVVGTAPSASTVAKTPLSEGDIKADALLPSVSVSSGISPVPGYLAESIRKGHFVDFTLLRPCNLEKLPLTEPTPTQLAKLLRVDLLPIRNFGDWAEAWAVFTGAIARFSPEKVPNLIGYFLLLSSASRKVSGMGWLAYDSAFRRHAVEKPSLDWAEVMPTLWFTTVLSKNTVTSKDPSPLQQTNTSGFCYPWNEGNCTFKRCRYPHVCGDCGGAHRRVECSGAEPATKRPCQQTPSSASPSK